MLSSIWRGTQSTSRIWTASFHSSRPLQESVRKRAARMLKKEQVELRMARAQHEEVNKPHPALGIRPGHEAKWDSCDLANILLTEEKIHSTPPRPLETDKPLVIPTHLNFGIGEQETNVLFDLLPDIASQQSMLKLTHSDIPDPETIRGIGQAQDAALKQANSNAVIMSRLVDLRNANSAGIAYENRKRIVEAFSEPGKPGDTGRAEVQAALLTARIRDLWQHLVSNRRDIHGRRPLLKLLHQRAKMLRYLRRIDRDRYDSVLVRLGIEPGAVEGEINLPKI